MRVAVIGASGHIGSFLVPRLVRAGHEVVAISRGHRKPYGHDEAWDGVERVAIDRAAADAEGTFGTRMVELGADVVVDLICFTEDSARHLVDALRGRVDLLLHCGSIWMHGPSLKVPLTEESVTEPFGAYGLGKAAIARLLREETRSSGLRTASLHPGHISGPGWPPINPLGNLDPDVWARLATGAEVLVPGIGAELLHHVHADDVAQGFALAVEQPDVVAGRMFHVTADSALTVRGFAGLAASWFGRQPQLRSVSWPEYRAATSAEYADQSWQHLSRSQYATPALARDLLGYRPRYEPEAAAREAVDWQVANGLLELTPPSGL